MHNFPSASQSAQFVHKKNLTFFLTCMPCVLFMLKIIFNLCLGTFAPLTLPSKTAHKSKTCLGCTISLGESIGAICARTKPYLFSYMYALCTVYAKDIFNLCLGTFAPLTLPSKTAYMFRMHNFPRRVNRRSLCTKKPYLFSYMYVLCTVYAKDVFNLCLGTFGPLTLPT